MTDDLFHLINTNIVALWHYMTDDLFYLINGIQKMVGFFLFVIIYNSSELFRELKYYGLLHFINQIIEYHYTIMKFSAFLLDAMAQNDMKER